MKLKNVYFRGIAYLYDFFDVVHLSYKPSNFARATVTGPMPWVKQYQTVSKTIKC